MNIDENRYWKDPYYRLEVSQRQMLEKISSPSPALPEAKRRGSDTNGDGPGLRQHVADYSEWAFGWFDHWLRTAAGRLFVAVLVGVMAAAGAGAFLVLGDFEWSGLILATLAGAASPFALYHAARAVVAAATFAVVFVVLAALAAGLILVLLEVLSSFQG